MNVAMQSILFLYKQVLGAELTGIQALRAKKDKRLPVVLTKTEVLAVLEQITDPHFRLQAKLLYGTGMRLLECLRLRVKDVDFKKHQIAVRDTKGNEDRVTMLPLQLTPILQEHLRHVKQFHEVGCASEFFKIVAQRQTQGNSSGYDNFSSYQMPDMRLNIGSFRQI